MEQTHQPRRALRISTNFSACSRQQHNSSSRFVWVLWVCALLAVLGNSHMRHGKFLNGPHCNFSQLYVYEKQQPNFSIRQSSSRQPRRGMLGMHVPRIQHYK